MMKFGPGTVLVMDRGYNDYDWFAELTDQGVFLVTRMKDNASYGVVEKRNTPEKGNVRSDLFLQHGRSWQRVFLSPCRSLG